MMLWTLTVLICLCSLPYVAPMSPVRFKLCHVSPRVTSGQQHFSFPLSVKAESIVPHAAEPRHCCRRSGLPGGRPSSSSRPFTPSLSKSSERSPAVVASTAWLASRSGHCRMPLMLGFPGSSGEKVLPSDSEGRIFFPNSRPSERYKELLLKKYQVAPIHKWRGLPGVSIPVLIDFYPTSGSLGSTICASVLCCCKAW